MARQDFASRTKRIVAERAAFRCSFPACDRTTIGPGVAHDNVANTGVAAHIFSASPDGPRGQADLSDSELKSSRNAIWLCGHHAALVDKNRGNGYPPELLLSYKSLHEARIAREQQRITTPYGWFQELAINCSPLFSKRQIIRFGKVTVIVGGNGAGKTAICEWLKSFNDPNSLQRWIKKDGDLIDLNVTFHKPEEKKARLVISQGQVEFYDDGLRVPFYPVPIKIVRLPQSGIASWLHADDADQTALVGDVLSIDKCTIQNILADVRDHNIWGLQDIEVVGRKIMTHDSNRNKMVCMASLSDGTRQALMIELCISYARVVSRITPTLLLIEQASCLSPSRFLSYLDYLLSTDHHFQSIITTIDDLPSNSWNGWEIAKIIGQRPNGRIVQSR